jgi:hypothetical protein
VVFGSDEGTGEVVSLTDMWMAAECERGSALFNAKAVKDAAARMWMGAKSEFTLCAKLLLSLALCGAAPWHNWWQQQVVEEEISTVVACLGVHVHKRTSGGEGRGGADDRSVI